MPADSLASMARRSCSKYVRNLTDIGDCPVRLVAPLLSKIDNPDQLRTLETNSPQVVGYTREAWINLIKRDVPNFESRMPDNWRETIFADENADRWWKVYKKLKKQAERESVKADEELAAKLKGINQNREAGSVGIVDRKLVSTGKNTYAKARFDYNDALYNGRKPGWGAAAGSSAKKPFFERLTKGAVTKHSAKMRTPTHLLKPTLKHEVRTAPMSLVEDIRAQQQREKERQEQERLSRERQQQAELEGRTTRIHPPINMGKAMQTKRHGEAQKPSAPLHAPRGPDGKPYDMTKDREARLRALKNGGGGSSYAQPNRREIARLTSDFLEDVDEDEDDNDRSDSRDDKVMKTQDEMDEDLFGLSKPTSKPTPISSPAKSVKTTSSPVPLSKRRVSPPMGKPNPATSLQPAIIRKRKDPPTLFRPAKR